MFTWINKALGAAAASLLLLSACVPTTDLFQSSRALSQFSGPPPSRMGVASGAVIVQGPKGYCIDRDASADHKGQSALVVLSACRALGAGMMTSAPAQSAILTAAVAPAGRVIDIDSHSLALKAFFATHSGRTVLSRSGDPRTVKVDISFPHEGAWLLHLSDSAPFLWGEVQAEYWRAVLPLGGRMVTLSVLTMPDEPITREAGQALLIEFIAQVRSATEKAAKTP